MLKSFQRKEIYAHILNWVHTVRDCHLFPEMPTVSCIFLSHLTAKGADALCPVSQPGLHSSARALSKPRLPHVNPQ